MYDIDFEDESVTYRMTEREKIVIRILFFIAAMFAEDDWLKKELSHLRNHITYGTKDI